MPVKGKFANIIPAITIGMLAVTGFAQMPIFKRYYIADIPGFGWLAKFYVTHYMHYLLAAALLFFLASKSVSWFFKRNRSSSFTTKIQRIILAGLVVTGVMLVIRNFPGYYFPPDMVIFLDLAHLGLSLILMINSLIAFIASKNLKPA